MLELYRRALAYGPAAGSRRRSTFAWLSGGESVLALGRGRIACVVNLSQRPVDPHTVVPRLTGSVVLASGPLDGDRLPPDTAVWMLPD